MPLITADKIKQKISGAGFSELIKQKLVAALPYLGQNSLKFLNANFTQADFVDTQVPVLEIVSSVQEIMQDLSKEKTESIVGFFESALNNPNYEFGRFVIPFSLDLRDYLNKHNFSGSKQVWQELEKFESQVFQFLPVSELEEITKNNILYFISNLRDTVLEFKRNYWLVELSDDGTWAQTLRGALENNPEQLGNSGLVRDEKNYPPTVANWLKDYFAFNNKPLTERAAYDQVQYIERAPNVQRLNVYERKDLLEIIKLHAWLMNPEVTENEINAYEADLSGEKPQASAPVDWVKAAQQRRTEEQQKIDSKIEELKNKAQ